MAARLAGTVAKNRISGRAVVIAQQKKIYYTCTRAMEERTNLTTLLYMHLIEH